MYRHVFSLRREVFTHRPIPNSEGHISPKDQETFFQQCRGICVTLLLLMCILEPAMPQETGLSISLQIYSLPQLGTKSFLYLRHFSFDLSMAPYISAQVTLPVLLCRTYHPQQGAAVLCSGTLWPQHESRPSEQVQASHETVLTLSCGRLGHFF